MKATLGELVECLLVVEIMGYLRLGHGEPRKPILLPPDTINRELPSPPNSFLLLEDLSSIAEAPFSHRSRRP